MFEIIAFTLIACIGVLWCYIKWTKRHINQLATKFKCVPSYPIIGSIPIFWGTKQQFSKRIFKMLTDFGSEPVTLWIGPLLYLIISKPEDIQIVLNNSSALKKGWFYKFTKKHIGESLVSTISTEKWQKHRRLINPAFSLNVLKQYVPIFNEKNDVLIRNLRKEVGKTLPFNLMDYILPMAIDTICQTAMGYNLNCKSSDKSEFGSAMIKAEKLIVMRVLKPWLYVDIIYSIYERITGTYKVFEMLNKIPTQVIKDKKQAFVKKKLSNELRSINDQENQSPKSFLDLLLEISEANLDSSDIDLKGEVVSLMMAGSESLSETLCFCLFMLAIHPKIQGNVYNEICELVGESDEPLTMEDVNKFKYLEQVIMETKRLFPNVPMIARELENDIKIFSGDCVLPKNTVVAINIYGTHRNPELHENPLDFNPENFSSENTAKRHKYSFLPFSGGTRGCIGMKYAVMLIKLTIIKFLKNFSMHTDITLTDIPLEYNVTMKSFIGFPVTIHPRDKRSTF